MNCPHCNGEVVLRETPTLLKAERIPNSLWPNAPNITDYPEGVYPEYTVVAKRQSAHDKLDVFEQLAELRREIAELKASGQS